MKKLVIILGLMAVGFYAGSLFAGDLGQSEKSVPPKHVVSVEELDKMLRGFADERRAQLEKLELFFDLEMVQKGLSHWGIRADQVKAAIKNLDDSELGYLAGRAEIALADLSGGSMSRIMFYAILVIICSLPFIIMLIFI